MDERASGDDSGSVAFAVAVPAERRLDEPREERMRRVRLALELGVELATQEPGVVGKLDNLAEMMIR